MTSGDVSGTSIFYGINNQGTGIIRAKSVTGTGDSYGIFNFGMIEAIDDVTGSSSGTSPGLSNKYGLSNSESGTIIATNVYYCQTISNIGQIIGAIGCGCPNGTSCTSTVTQCIAPTPVLSGNLTTCASCETADSTKPYWNGFACVAEL